MQRFHYDTIDSTSSQARRLAEEHPGERLLVTAATQSSGRGQHGRAWESPHGGAWMSIVWPLRNELRAGQPLSLLAAAAVRQALVEVVGDSRCDLQIKWPNDVLIADRKVAGILCEVTSNTTDAYRGRILIIGVGVNVNFDLAQLPEPLHLTATTLSASCGRSLNLESVIAAIARHLVDAIELLGRQSPRGD
jgi:BirA family biotin operon repressor/biotin-[acetyl-CoA-carboxylase] ligase